jgi:apolipoprotein N-acyltransferase
MRQIIRLSLPALIGVFSALLLGRFVAKALAARPDNPCFVWLYAGTEWLRLPLAWLDAGRPQYGAVIEVSTLLMALLLPVAGLLAARCLQHMPPQDRPNVSETNAKGIHH